MKCLSAVLLQGSCRKRGLRLLPFYCNSSFWFSLEDEQLELNIFIFHLPILPHPYGNIYNRFVFLHRSGTVAALLWQWTVLPPCFQSAVYTMVTLLLSSVIFTVDSQPKCSPPLSKDCVEGLQFTSPYPNYEASSLNICGHNSLHIHILLWNRENAAFLAFLQISKERLTMYTNSFKKWL